MNKRSLFAIVLTASFITGCQSAPAPTPNATTPATTPTATPQPKRAAGEPPECGMSDPASVENCRFWRAVEAGKKKSHSNNVVKHSPGSIAQP